MVGEYQAASDDVAGKHDVLADCIVRLSAEERRHFIDYSQVETEQVSDLDGSAYGLNAAALKSNRPKDLEAQQVFLLDMIDSLLVNRIKANQNELAASNQAAQKVFHEEQALESMKKMNEAKI